MTTDQLAERRFEEMVDWMVGRLASKGSVVESVEWLTSHGGPDAVEKWRRAGHAAARRLELPVRTGISRDATLVWITEEHQPISSDQPHSLDSAS